MAISVNNETYFSPKDAAEFLDLKIQTIYQRWKEWNWTPYHFGRKLLFKKTEVTNWLENQIVPA